jgi:hypothetical protein
MRELGHVICFIEFCGIYFINTIPVDLTLLFMALSDQIYIFGLLMSYTPVLALHEDMIVT